MTVLTRTYQEAVNKGYVTKATQEGDIANSVFIGDMMTRFVWKGSRVYRITDVSNYNGTRTVTAYYSSFGVVKSRAVYIVKE